MIKFRECGAYSAALDITTVLNQLIAQGWNIDPDDAATVSPLITHTIRRFGDWHLDLTPPEATGDGHLALLLAGAPTCRRTRPDGP